MAQNLRADRKSPKSPASATTAHTTWRDMNHPQRGCHSPRKTSGPLPVSPQWPARIAKPRRALKFRPVPPRRPAKFAEFRPQAPPKRVCWPGWRALRRCRPPPPSRRIWAWRGNWNAPCANRKCPARPAAILPHFAAAGNGKGWCSYCSWENVLHARFVQTSAIDVVHVKIEAGVSHNPILKHPLFQDILPGERISAVKMAGFPHP